LQMRFGLLPLAAALLRGSDQRAAEETRVAVLSLLQAAVKPEAKAVAEKATTPAKAEAKATPAAKAEPKAAPAAKAEPKAAPAAKAEPKAAPAAKTEAKASAPKAESKEHQQLVVDQLMKLASNLEANEKKIVQMDREEQARSSKSNITSMMKDKDKEMWENFDKFNHRMNEKTKVGSLDVISKIKHAVHFIKKGAMSGDQNAMAGLEDVIKSMSQMTR